ncbi:hypothetical protein RRG08_065136 [Elysia crispata]|uniref:Uncharacterized protein n=1 Tax=Elysia crispata TaxID=231223 RepID=A0AAE0Z9T3_9GAST|nr:hypothetical protein RRG08_065136 [Elysia crispata]
MTRWSDNSSTTSLSIIYGSCLRWLATLEKPSLFLIVPNLNPSDTWERRLTKERTARLNLHNWDNHRTAKCGHRIVKPNSISPARARVPLSARDSATLQLHPAARRKLACPGPTSAPNLEATLRQTASQQRRGTGLVALHRAWPVTLSGVC